MNKTITILTSVCLFVMTTNGIQPLHAQRIGEDFDTVFGLFPGDDNEPVAGWVGALQSSDFGPTGIFPGVDAECGFFDAHSGEGISYVAMNFNNARFDSNDTTCTWLMTPVVQLIDRSTVSFWTRTVDASIFPDRLQVRISTNGESVNVGESATNVGDFDNLLLDINELHTVGGYPEKWTEFEIELNGFAGVDGRIALRYFNESMNVNGNYIGIDTFRFIPFLIGDVNCDGAIDLLDIQPFLDTITNATFNDKADLNGDDVVDLLDVAPFVDAIVAASGA